jgi:sec-independent protein translocase protein TatA
VEIFGIGLGELLIIAVVALVILGPDRLPEAFRSLGKGVADFRRALEPARNAWAEVQREINAAGAAPNQQAGGSRQSAGEAQPPSGNPWEVHPLAEGLSDEERERFFATGELPEWRLKDMDKYQLSAVAGQNGAEEGELAALDYPMPHGEAAYSSASAVAGEEEELFYPAPTSATKEASTE